MKKIWNRFTAWLSGWPEGTREDKKMKKDEELFRKEKIIEKSVQESHTRKAKKPRGLNPKKKKARRQGNMN